VESSDGHTSRLVKNLFPDSQKIHLIENPVAERGHMSSVKAGLRALPPGVDGAMIVLADMPLIPSSMIDALSETFEESGDVVIPVSEGTQYHPRIIPRSFFSEFLELGDNEKGTAVIDALGDRITTVQESDPTLFQDIDTPDDLTEVAQRLRGLD